MRNPLIALCGFLVLLAACTLTPKNIGKAYMFALIPAKTVAVASMSGDSLTVALPVAAPELDTYRIALIRDGKRWDYYAGARWSEFLPVLVQDNITKTLEDARLFKTVTTDQAGVKGGQVLKLAIRSFQAEYVAGRAAPVIKIRLVSSLMSLSLIHI